MSSLSFSSFPLLLVHLLQPSSTSSFIFFTFLFLFIFTLIPSFLIYIPLSNTTAEMASLLPIIIINKQTSRKPRTHYPGHEKQHIP